MRQTENNERDIAQEAYKGPNAISAAAGEGFIAHFQWAVIGLVGGGLATWLFHEPVLAGVKKIREGAKAWVKDGNRFQQGTGKFGLGLFGHGKDMKLSPEKIEHLEEQSRHGFGLWFLNHTIGLFQPGKDLIKKYMDDRLATAVTGGGIFAFIGYVILPWALARKGAERGAEGRRQFERAQDEIWDLRAENDQLRGKYRDLRNKVYNHDDANVIAVSGDEPPAIREQTEIPVTSMAKVDHPDSPTSVTPPKIESPTVTDPLTGKTTKVSEVNFDSPTSVTPPKIEAPKPAAPPVDGSGKQWWDEADRTALRDSPTSVTPPKIEAPKPAAPPVDGSGKQWWDKADHTAQSHGSKHTTHASENGSKSSHAETVAAKRAEAPKEAALV